jgi:hypothetical protein
MLATPAIALTDYAIALEAIIFALILVRKGPIGQIWAAAFVCTGLAAGFGGTAHGFVNTLSLSMQIFLWQGVVANLGAAGCLMVIAAASETLKGRSRYSMEALALLKAGITLPFAIAHLSFAWSVVDYLISMLVVLGLRQRKTTSTWNSVLTWTSVGVGLSAVAILPLLFSKAETDWLRPEVQYHIIQMAALYCFFYAASIHKPFNH